MRVRKRVRTDRERLTVPKKRVEVSVERVPVEGAEPEAATTPQIGEEEIVVPVVEEEVVVEKRPVVKEEIHIHKRVVEEVEAGGRCPQGRGRDRRPDWSRYRLKRGPEGGHRASDR